MEAKWLPFIYQYSLGGLLFFGALGAAVRARALDTASRLDRRQLTALVAGYFGFLAVHAAWIASVR